MGRVDDYLQKAQKRAARRKSRWNLLLIPLSVAGIAAMWVVLVMGLLQVQRSLIPADAILSSYTRVGSIFIFVPALFPAMAIGMMLANLVAWFVLPARRAFQKEAKGVKGASFKKAMKHLGIAAGILLLATAPLGLLGAMNYFYVTHDGIYLSPFFSAKEKHYGWSDIVEVQTRCIAERDNLHLNFILHMSDRGKVDLLEEPRMKFVDVYDRIKPLIAQQTHIHYTSEISEGGIKRLRSRYQPHNAERILKVLRPNS